MDGSYWITGFGEAAPESEQTTAGKIKELEGEVTALRKELAAKALALSKKEQDNRAAQEKWAEQRAAELATAAAAPKNQVIRSLEHTVNQLEIALAQRTEELEESRHLVASQKRALQDALAAAAERQAAEAAADDAGRSAATAAAEEELERLMQQLSELKARTAVTLAAKDAGIQGLKQQLKAQLDEREHAVVEAQAAAAATTEAALAAAEQSHRTQLAELQAQLDRAQASTCIYYRQDHEDLSMSLAVANKEKLHLQREFDAFKDLTAQTHRHHREEHTQLLEENAALKARIAAGAARLAMGSSGPADAVNRISSHDVGSHYFTAARGLLTGRELGVQGKAFSAVEQPAGVGGAVEQWFTQLDRQRKGLVPALVLGSLVLLVVFIAVVRAAASTQDEHKGALCFFAKLGIQIGEGCGSTLAGGGSSASVVSQALGELVESTPRVKDVITRHSSSAITGQQQASSVGKAAGGRHLLQ
eukprot:GHRR01002859.1.p1 GENE.GHRR01002859.1~~GHRR01002859.1.p1  ORF type:complete len:477 (+),score=206.58 GHRR01002859.1:283-1713(+)